MQFDWRAIPGPALTAATTLIVFTLDRHLVAVPDPAPLFVCIVALASSAGGIASGLASAAIVVAASALFFTVYGAMPDSGNSDMARILLLALSAVGAAVVPGLLRGKWVDAFAFQRRRHDTAERLRAALDQIDIGIVLLRPDTRAEFINRAFRKYFTLPDHEADKRPPFIALMYHSRATGVWELPEDELSTFIARSTRMIRAGDSTPLNLNLRDGKVLRFRCSALPGGRRMLSYSPVTDLVRQGDDLAGAEYYRSLRGSERALARQLDAAE